jgi:hypothetical protein
MKIKTGKQKNNYLYNHFKKETATVLITVAILMPLFILIIGMTVDIGRALVYKEEINKACMVSAEEAAKEIEFLTAQQSGFTRLDTQRAQEIAVEYFTRNYLQKPGSSINNFGCSVFEESSNPKYLQVNCQAKVDCYFLKMFGIEYIKINTAASSRLKSIKN